MNKGPSRSAMTSKKPFLFLAACSLSLTLFVSLYMSTSMITFPGQLMNSNSSPNDVSQFSENTLHQNHHSEISHNSHNEGAYQGTHIQEPLQYPEGAEKIFFMIKTGGTELWNKLPVHLYASLPKMPKFQFYSDAPGQIADYDVIDSLANVTEGTKSSEAFEMYRFQKHLYDDHGVYDYSESKLNKGWDLDKFKNIPILEHAYNQSPDSEWFFMMDADSYVMVENMVQWVKKRNPNEPVYHGSVVGAGVEFAHGGSGILLSRRAVEITIGAQKEYLAMYEEVAMKHCCGDAVLALMLRDLADIAATTGEESFGKKPFQGNTYWDVEIAEETWCIPILTFHHSTPHDVQVLWEWEQSKQGAVVTYADIYRDFYQEYITDFMDNWDNNAKDIQIREDDEEGRNGWQSFDQCRNACEENPYCLSFRFLPNEKSCGLGYSVRLGRPTHKYLEFKYDQDYSLRDNQHTQSGWMVERIRNVRSQSHCDAPDSRESGKFEGYYWRQKNVQPGFYQEDLGGSPKVSEEDSEVNEPKDE